MSLRDRIAALPRRVEAVDCPELGGTVYLRVIPLADLLAVTAKARAGADPNIPLLLASLCDAEGNPEFGPEDGPILAALPGPPLLRLADQAAGLNVLTPAAAESSGNG